MEKITRSQFIQKYGFDPHDKSSFTKQAPTTGAVSGSNITVPKQTLTPDEVNSAMSSQPKEILSADEVAKINGGVQSEYKPGKFIQALEDIRPDYIEKGQGSGEGGKRTFGDIYHNIGEGIGDVGVGVVKGITRMPVNIAQTLTPDAMWGENSLLNSDSERAQAFASATKGKTGLQKLGATGVDVASLLTPVGLEKGGATLAGLAGQKAGTLAKLATGGNTGMIASGINKLAPIVGESIAGTAMLGGDAGDIGADAAISVALPTVLKPAYKYLKSTLSGPMANKIIGEVVGSGSMAQRGIDDAIGVISQDTEKKLDVIKSGRKLVENMVSPLFVKSNFGTTTDAVQKFNEAADLVMTYYAPKPGPNRVMDWSEGATKLANDINEAGSLKTEAVKMLGDIDTDPANVFSQTVKGIDMSTKKSNGFIKASNNIKNVISQSLSNPYNKKGKFGKLDLESLNKFKNDMWELRSQANNTDEKEVYKKFAEAIDTRIGNEAKKAGKGDLFQDYLRENSEYSLLKDTQKIMDSLANKNNPMYTTQMFDHVFGLASSGLLSDAVGAGGAKSGITYAAMRLLSKMLGKTVGDAKLRSIAENPYRRAIEITERSAKEQSRKGLTDLIEKQTASKAKK